LGLSPKPAWAEVWHLWKVIIPRRSITGRLLTGQVWRRHDGRRWIYKKFTEYAGEGASQRNRGLVVRDARRCRAPHHEGLDLILRV